MSSVFQGSSESASNGMSDIFFRILNKVVLGGGRIGTGGNSGTFVLTSMTGMLLV